MSNTMKFPPHIFLQWSSAFGSGCGDLSLSTHCLLRATLSYMIYFWSPVMTSSSNGSFLCRERRLVAIDQRSAVFFSLKPCGTKTPSLLTFPIFSKWWHMVDCDVFSLTANSQVLWHSLHSTNDFKASASKSDECPGLSSSFNNVSPERNFTNQFRTARSVMVPLPYTLQILHYI